MNRWMDGWMDGVKSLCTKLPTTEKGNFNNPPDQSVAPLKNGLAKKLTDWSGGLLKGAMDILKSG